MRCGANYGDGRRGPPRVRRGGPVIGARDPLGLSPAVMQSNHDVGVAGILSVNAHGWPVPYGPFGVTVRLPHIALGGVAVFAGLLLAPRWAPEAAGRR